MTIKENPAGTLLKVNKSMAGADIKKTIENHFREVQDSNEKVSTSIDRNSFGNGAGQNSSSTPQASFGSGQKREAQHSLPSKYLSPSIARNPYATGE